MKKQVLLILPALLICLFIYLFYRTERTVITQLFIWFVTLEEFTAMRKSITGALPLQEFIVYSLPEGLWVFCITLTSQSLFVKIGTREVSLSFVPLLVSIGLELFQLLNLTQGRFDWMDIGVSLFFWIIVTCWMNPKPVRQNIFQPVSTRSMICLISYFIVYLAHVWK